MRVLPKKYSKLGIQYELCCVILAPQKICANLPASSAPDKPTFHLSDGGSPDPPYRSAVSRLSLLPRHRAKPHWSYLHRNRLRGIWYQVNSPPMEDLHCSLSSQFGLLKPTLCGLWFEVNSPPMEDYTARYLSVRFTANRHYV